MSAEDFVADAKDDLGTLTRRSGRVLYGGVDTLASGDLYILGLNPGGWRGMSIARDLDAFPHRRENAYIDEAWGGREPGAAPLQRRLCQLVAALGYDMREVCAGNLIFVRSKTREHLGDNYQRYADRCWPVHERILEIVQPRLIVAFGNSGRSPYGYLRDRFRGVEKTRTAGHGPWRLKGFTTSAITNESIFVAGIPHLSRYSPDRNPQLVRWLTRELSSNP